MSPKLRIPSEILLVAVLLLIGVAPVLPFRSAALRKWKLLRKDGSRSLASSEPPVHAFLGRRALSTDLSATNLPVEPLVGGNETSAAVLSTTIMPSDAVNRRKKEKSELLLEFEEKIGLFYTFTSEDISCIANPRDRALFEGIAASQDEPLVYQAFALLFENLLPLRVAGRAMFRHLLNIMHRSIEQRDKQVVHLKVATGLSEEEIQVSRMTFLAFAPKVGKDGPIVPLQFFRESGMAAKLAEKMGYTSVDSFLQKLTPDGRKNLNFEEFMTGLHGCAIDGELCTLECDLSNLLQQVIEGVEALPPPIPSPSQLKHEKRYAHMLKSFEAWKNLLPANQEGFWEEVLRGCLQGAQNPRVVEALRIVYVDDTVMRMAGNAIFFGVKKKVSRCSETS